MPNLAAAALRGVAGDRSSKPIAPSGRTHKCPHGSSAAENDRQTPGLEQSHSGIIEANVLYHALFRLRSNPPIKLAISLASSLGSSIGIKWPLPLMISNSAFGR